MRIEKQNDVPSMSQNIAAFCYVAFFALALASPFTPVFFIWRLAGLSVIAYAVGKVVEGPVHWSDQNFGYAIGIIVVFLFCCAIALMIIIRLAISAARKALTFRALKGPQNRLMIYFDTSALIAIGCFAGLLLFITLAFALSGADFSINLDLSIAILASAIATVVFVLSRKKIAIIIISVFAVLAASALIGSRQTDHILETAEALANDRAWCLTTSGGFGPISEVRQLGFFALPKGNSYPHLGLLIQENDQTMLAAHWSIRQQAFHKDIIAVGSVPTCQPIRGFAEALKSGYVDKDTYSVGSEVYSIGQDLDPQAFTDRVSIRSNQLTGPDNARSETTERVELIYNPREPHIPDDAVSLMTLPDPDELDTDNLTGRNRLIIAGFDEVTQKSLFLHCLHGSYADRICRAQVFEGSLGYNFYLPLDQVNQWRETAEQVKALFESLRVN
ncbi:MAG: hypothetical protein AAF919_15410 [Pseudomonadota bacterium]